jgi:putative ABC transport system substrate-binding protein
MKRRAFVTGLGAALAARLVAEVQAARLPLVGIVYPGQPSVPTIVRGREAFLRTLRENGYAEGDNIVLEHRYAGVAGPREAVNELVHRTVDVLMVGGTPAALIAQRATTTIPIVGWSMADPVADGLVSNLARPEANITGNTFLAPELSAKRFQLFREIIPKISEIAVLQHPGVYGEQTMRNMLTEVERAAKDSNVDVQIFDARTPRDFRRVFGDMVKAHVGALILFSSPMFYVNYRQLVDLSAEHRLPTMYYFREAVEAGGLMYYGADIGDLARLAANYVVKILGGAKPADLPIEQPTKFELVINLKTAQSLGLTIPQSLLLRADQVIE